MLAETMNNTLVAPTDIRWGPGPAILPPGAQEVRLYGDPTKAGLFAMRFKLPKGYSVPPHTLSKAGLFTVITGTFRIGMGETVDPSKATAMPAGSFVALAPSTPHFVSVTRRQSFNSTISGHGRSPTSTRRKTRDGRRNNATEAYGGSRPTAIAVQATVIGAFA
jgi:quercetin dioxygenase-like cupin family protein